MNGSGRRVIGACAITLLTAALLSPIDDARATSPVLFGASPGQRGTETKQQALDRLQSQIGRSLDIVRVYKRWDASFPDDFDTAVRAAGQTELLSVKALRTSGAVVPWASLAQAQPGDPLYAELVSWADRVRDFGVPINVTFHHEPTTSDGVNGGAADFVAAWQRFVDVFRAEGATNASFVWIMTSKSFSDSSAGPASSWYPGDAYVDALAVDGYNYGSCRGTTGAWKPVNDLFASFLAFATTHPSKPLIVAEWGGAEDPADPNRKGAWFADARTAFLGPAWAQLRAVLYWNNVSPNYPACDFSVDTSAASLSGFRAMALDPAYSGPVPTPLPSSSPSPSPSDSPSPSASPSSSPSDSPTPSDSPSPADSPSDSPSPSPSPSDSTSPSDSPSPSPSDSSSPSDSPTPPPPPPQPPTTPGTPVAISRSTTSVDVWWTGSTDPDSSSVSYEVFRDGGSAPFTTTGNLAYTDGSLAPGSSHTYMVRAVDPEGHESPSSAWSTTVVVQSPPTAPGAPSGASATASSIDLTWTPSTDPDGGPISYQVYRDGGATSVGTVSSTTFRDAGLTAGSSHTYVVRALDPQGNGAWSSSSSPIRVLILVDGFDSFPTGWTTKNLTLDQTLFPPVDAKPSVKAKVSNAAAYGRRSLPITTSTICVTASVDVQAISKSAFTVIGVLDPTGKMIGTVDVDPSTKRLSVVATAAGKTFPTTASVATSTWVTVKVCATSGSSGSWSLWLNGTQVLAPTMASNGSVGFGRVQLGEDGKGTATVNFDHLVVSA